MLRTRLWLGSLLALLIAGVLFFDRGPWYPFLLVLLLLLALVACYELLQLTHAVGRPPLWLCGGAVAAVVLANWPAHGWAWAQRLDPDPWHWILGTFTAVVLSTFLWEMARFREPGGTVARLALVVWITAYLGLLTSGLAQLRWLGERGTIALALAIFVPKCCDIGAYFTGRFLGRHRMAPVLSPKKTWEGLAGGLALAVLATHLLNTIQPALPSVGHVVGFGISVGLAGVLGDLAESMIKRDGQRKDASQVVPGFGGVLDVVDSVLFAGPVAYQWLR